MRPSRSKLAGWAAALNARAELKLGSGGPIPDILRLVEDSPRGVPVAVLDLPKGVAGAFARREAHSFIFVNGNEAVVRQRFTLAHEFGHHRLGHQSVVDPDEVISGNTDDPREIEANSFAAEFLVPREALRTWLEEAEIAKVDLEALVRVASYFGVSAQSMRYRLQDAGVVTRRTALDALDAAIAGQEHIWMARQLALRDPSDTLAELRRARQEHLPRAMEEAGFKGFAKGLVPLERLAEALRRPAKELAAELADRGVAPPEDEPDY